MPIDGGLFDKLGRHAHEPALLLGLLLKVHLHGHLAGLLNRGLLARALGDLALGGLVVKELRQWLEGGASGL